MKRIGVMIMMALLFCTCIGLSACGAGVDTAATTEPAVTLSPEESERAACQAYLDTVSYLDFELTGEASPYFVGRWFEKTLDGVAHTVTLSDGSHLYFMVDGADSVFVNFTEIHAKQTPYFSYSIDGATPVRQSITQAEVKLPDNGKHTVRIIADGLTESEDKWNGEIGFALRSVEVSEGGKLYGIKPRNKVIFFYGDSITEGVASLKGQYNSEGNSATRAYPWYTAKELGAVPYYIGYGATGLVQTGSFNTMLRAIDSLSSQRKVDSSAIAAITPDLIVINHGHNDASHGVTVAQFRLAARDAIQALQKKYPDVPIVYVVPFAEKSNDTIVAYGEKLDTLATEIKGLYVVHTADWGLTFTDGVHPNMRGGMTAGARLADALEEIMGKDFFKP